jgi:type II secretory pathway component PulJ
LEQQLAQMADLAVRNEQLSNRLAQATAPAPLSPDELRELLHLRGQVGVLRRQPGLDLDKAREENGQLHAVLERFRQTLTETNPQATADYWPRGTWVNSGHDTPEATLQSALWAASRGDLTNLSANFTDEAQKALLSQYKDKPEAEASVRLAEDARGVQSAQILGREVLPDGSVLLTVEIEGPEGFQTVKMPLKKDGNQWKLAAPP